MDWMKLVCVRVLVERGMTTSVEEEGCDRE
jgi:hypothetical protein